jgi:hypothetical protein
METSRAQGEQALQALSTVVRANAGQLAAPAAAQGLCTRLRPSGVAAMQRSCAQRGPGAGGSAVPRAAGGLLPREQQRRGRASFASCGTCTGARTGSRAPAAPGRCPRDAQGTLPARCSSSCRQAWLTGCEVAHPGQERAGVLTPLCARAGAESVVREGAPDAPQAAQACEAPRPLAPADTVGALLGGRLAGQGGPRSKAEAAQRQAQWGTGEQRQQQQAALGGGAPPWLPRPARPQRGRHAWAIQTRRGGGGRGKGSRTRRPAPRRGGVWPAGGGRRRR